MIVFADCRNQILFIFCLEFILLGSEAKCSLHEVCLDLTRTLSDFFIAWVNGFVTPLVVNVSHRRMLYFSFEG